MFIGITIGIVPLMYLVLRAKFRELDDNDKNTTLYITSVILLTVVSYIAFTASTHELFYTGILSICFGFGMTHFMFKGQYDSYKMAQEQGYDVCLKNEYKKLLYAFIFAVVMFILKVWLT